MKNDVQTKTDVQMTEQEVSEKFNRGRKVIDFVGSKKIFFGVSLGIMLIGIICNFIFGTTLDIQFSGGATLTFSYTSDEEHPIDQNALYDFIQEKTTDKITTSFSEDLMGNTGKNVSVQFSGNDSIETDIQKNLEKDPRKVHLGDNCLSHLKGNGVTFYNVSEKTCDAMSLGCGNQGGTRSIGPDSLGNTSPWTQMSDGVVSSGWFRDSDIVRGKVRCSAENFRDWLKACRKQPFRIMRLSEALVDFAANLLELLFNLMVLAKNEVSPLVNRGVVKATESRAQSLEDRKQANEELLMTVRKDGKIDVSKIPEGVEMKVRRYIMKLRPEEGLDGKKLEKLQDYLEKKSGALTRKQNVNAFIGDNAKAKMDARLQAGVDKKDMHREAGKKGRSQKEIRDARAKANTREG